MIPVKALVVGLWALATLALVPLVSMWYMQDPESKSSEQVAVEFAVGASFVALTALAAVVVRGFPIAGNAFRWTSIAFVSLGAYLAHVFRDYVLRLSADGVLPYGAYHQAAYKICMAGCGGTLVYLLVQVVLDAFPASPLVVRAVALANAVPTHKRKVLAHLTGTTFAYYLLTGVIRDVCGSFSVFCNDTKNDACVLTQSVLNAIAFLVVMKALGRLAGLGGIREILFDASTSWVSQSLAVAVPSFTRTICCPTCTPTVNLDFLLIYTLYVLVATPLLVLPIMALWDYCNRPKIDVDYTIRLLKKDDLKDFHAYCELLESYYTKTEVLEAMKVELDRRSAELAAASAVVAPSPASPRPRRSTRSAATA